MVLVPTEYEPDGHAFAVLGYFSSHPHSSANDIIDDTGMEPDSVLNAITQLKQEGIILRDRDFHIIESHGLGISKFATYVINSMHPTINKR